MIKLLIAFSISFTSCVKSEEFRKKDLIHFVESKISKDKKAPVYRAWIRKINFDLEMIKLDVNKLNEDQINKLWVKKNLLLECLSSFDHRKRDKSITKTSAIYFLKKEYYKILYRNKNNYNQLRKIDSLFGGKSWTMANKNKSRSSCNKDKL